MQDQYIELTTALPSSSAVYGLGERTPSTGMQLQRNGIPLALWNQDVPAADPDENNYGSRPNYLEIREGGDSPLSTPCCPIQTEPQSPSPSSLSSKP